MSKKTSKKKAWEALSRYWRTLHPVCQVCKKRKSTQTHHIVTRKAGGNALYFYEPNMLAVCYVCHNDLHLKGHLDYDEIRELIIDIIGEERYFQLRRMRNLRCKYTENKYKNIIRYYTKKVAECI
jgi:5-methylcytosine-specific restriction endonuclease McrA